jgi:DNA-directed RNA polymerase specialized sigma24 family protein
MVTEQPLEHEPVVLLRRINDEYGARIRAYVRHLDRGGVGASQLFDDLVGDIFLACRSLSRRDDLWPAILSVLRAEARQMQRIARREISDAALDAAVPAPNAASRAWRELLWAWERSLLSWLPPSQRAALEWHVMDDMSDAAIAQRLGVPIDRVRVLRHRAAQRCRRQVLSGRHGPPPHPDDA